MEKEQVSLIRIECLLEEALLEIAKAMSQPNYAPGLSILLLEVTEARNRAEYLLEQ